MPDQLPLAQQPACITLDAIYRNGLIEPAMPLTLPPETPVALSITTGVTIVATLKPEPYPAFEQHIDEQVVDAIYRDGAIIPLTCLNLAENTQLTLHLALRVTAIALLRTQTDVPMCMARSIPAKRPARMPRLAIPVLPDLRAWLAAPLAANGLLSVISRSELLILGLAMLVYLATRLIGLEQFPLYFHADEATQANLAERLLTNGLRDESNTFLPPFFRNALFWNLSFSIYVHLLPVALFGKAIFVTRATSVIVGALAPIAIALTLKLIFKNRFWWIVPVALATFPAWFIQSRTAFETAMMPAFYACFLCCYLLYRYRDPRYLIPGILFGGATFYSYANGQGVMLITGMLLLLSDIRYHIEQVRRRPWLATLALFTTALIAVQYIRFRLIHPEALTEHLKVLDSYWFHPISLSEKLQIFGANYLTGLSPLYWFFSGQSDETRHIIKDAGFLPLPFLPFGLIGVGICIRQWRSPAHRVVLVAILAAPFSSALVEMVFYRAVAMTVPALLVACLGFEQAAIWLRSHYPLRRVQAIVAITLVLMSGMLLRGAIVDGPTWYPHYNLYGMQYGASPVFTAIREELAGSPDTRITLSPAWTHNIGALAEYFLNPQERDRLTLNNIDEYLISQQPIQPDDLFVLTAEDYDRATKSAMLALDPPRRIISYPNGQPGFYFVHLRYVANIAELMAAQRERQHQLQEVQLEIDGQPVLVRHSLLDIGKPANLFDQQRETLARGATVNPIIYELEFANPRSVGGLGIDTWSVDFDLTVIGMPADGGQPITFTWPYRKMPREPHIDVDFPDGARTWSKLRIELQDFNQPPVAHIHVAEVALKP